MNPLGYKYAQICQSKERMFVYYYVENPETKKLVRKRVYLQHIKSKSDRLRYARKLKEKINNKLDNGWNPFIDDSENSKKYRSIGEALSFVLSYKSKYVRPRTIPQYRHRINILGNWLEKRRESDIRVYEFTENKATDFMNDLLINSQITARTYNNYLLDYRTFFNTLAKNRYIDKNPFKSIEKLPVTQAAKRPFTAEELSLYMDHIKENDYTLYITSHYTYCCGLRPAEICRLQIKDVKLAEGYIHISGNASKNKKVGIIPIPKFFLEELQYHLAGYPETDLICSRDLRPGQEQINPIEIAKRFRRVANTIGLPKDLIFYALKDTAADRLMSMGFSSKDIRDLFRHSNISTTDAYLKTRGLTSNPKLITDFPKPGQP